MSWSDGILGTHMFAAALETTVDDATGGGTQAQPSQTAVSGRPALDGLEGDAAKPSSLQVACGGLCSPSSAGPWRCP